MPFSIILETQCQTQFNTCVNDTTTRSIVEPDVNQEASNILNAIRTFANVGTGVYQLLSELKCSNIQQFLDRNYFNNIM